MARFIMSLTLRGVTLETSLYREVSYKYVGKFWDALVLVQQKQELSNRIRCALSRYQMPVLGSLGCTYSPSV